MTPGRDASRISVAALSQSPTFNPDNACSMSRAVAVPCCFLPPCPQEPPAPQQHQRTPDEESHIPIHPLGRRHGFVDVVQAKYMMVNDAFN